MKLTPAQIKQFDELGYLFFPSCFNEEEIALLRDDAEAILKLDRQEIWRIRLILESLQGTSEATTQVEVTPPGFGRWDLLFYALPFLAIGVLWSTAVARSRRKKQLPSTGDTPPALAH